MPPELAFSIVVPTYSRPWQLESCLNAISRLDYPRDRFEILVVDDGSPDPPEALIRQFQTLMNLRLLKQEHAGPAAARNHGAGRAQHPYVVFTDDDCAPLTEWLQKLSELFCAFPDYGIGGRRLNGFPD